MADQVDLVGPVTMTGDHDTGEVAVREEPTVTSSPRRSRLKPLLPVVVFDVGGPLVLYHALRSAGWSNVAALVLSGTPPAVGIALGALRHRRLDAIGALVLFGIVIGSVVGLASGSAHLVLLDGIVPTAVFGVVCLGSLRSERPMIFRLALESMGADTAKGRDFAERWHYPGFRHAFGVQGSGHGAAFSLVSSEDLTPIV
ncbi:hypothetical protein B1B_13693, partial [mine drainage metagenome]